MKYLDNSAVRRQDRLLDATLTHKVLKEGEFATLSMLECRDGEIAGYGIPVNYVWDGKESIYIHCAFEGHKIESLKSHNLITLTVVGVTKVISNKFTTDYQSVLVRGKIEMVECDKQREDALEIFLEKYSPEDMIVGREYIKKSFHRTAILKISITSISSKSKSN